MEIAIVANSLKSFTTEGENIAGTVSAIERKILRSLREITYHVGILMKDLVEMGKLVIQERKHIAGTTSGVLGGMDSRP